MLFEFYIYLARPTNSIWHHAPGGVRNVMEMEISRSQKQVRAMCCLCAGTNLFYDRTVQVMW